METHLNPEAREHYEKLLKILQDSGRFSPGDVIPLKRLAYLYSVADRLQAEVNQSWSEKFIKQNLLLYDRILKSILALESAFMLNPSSRFKGKVTTGPAKPKGPDRFTKKP